ncbi:hypothetical protein FRC02_002680, partial [Tulasnella sp. 418]
IDPGWRHRRQDHAIPSEPGLKSLASVGTTSILKQHPTTPAAVLLNLNPQILDSGLSKFIIVMPLRVS